MRKFPLLIIAVIAPPAASGEMLKGVVRDSLDTPISGAVVLIHWDSAGSTVGLKTNVGIKADLSIRTKDDGTFSVDLPPGFYDVFAASPAFTPVGHKVRITPSAAVDTMFRMNAEPLYTAEMGNQVEAARPTSFGERQASKALPAPTFYIAASGQYERVGSTLEVKGATNLPPGSRLSITLYDFVGYQSSILSETDIVTLDNNGFFKATLKPLNGRQFKANMVCDIFFDTNSIRQNESVLKVVGEKGRLLGVGYNPQVAKNSGENYYLEALVHIP